MAGKKRSSYFEAKVKKLLDDERVTITSIGVKYIWAEVIGNTQTYTCCFNRESLKWSCTCTYKTNYNLSQDVYCTHTEAADIVRVGKGLK